MLARMPVTSYEALHRLRSIIDAVTAAAVERLMCRLVELTGGTTEKIKPSFGMRNASFVYSHAHRA